MPSQEWLKEHFAYGETDTTGYLRWIKGPNKGKILSRIDQDLNGYKYNRPHVPGFGMLYLNRLIFTYHYGTISVGLVIDHRDENSLNNYIENLQQLTTTQNTVKSKQLLPTEYQFDLFKSE